MRTRITVLGVCVTVSVKSSTSIQVYTTKFNLPAPLSLCFLGAIIGSTVRWLPFWQRDSSAIVFLIKLQLSLYFKLFIRV